MQGEVIHTLFNIGFWLFDVLVQGFLRKLGLDGIAAALESFDMTDSVFADFYRTVSISRITHPALFEQ